MDSSSDQGHDAGNESHARTETAVDPADGRVPKLAMQFLSEEEAYSFYKIKEKTTKGSRRPVGHFEKATGKKKKNLDNTVQVQPQGISMGHPDFFANQMAAYQLQYHNILNAATPPSIGSTIPMSAHTQELAGSQPNGPIGNIIPMPIHPQELVGLEPYGPIGNTIPMPIHSQELAGLEPYGPIGNTIPMLAHTQHLAGSQPNGAIGNTIPMSIHSQELAGLQPYSPVMGHPTNHMYTYLQQQKYALNSSLQGTIGTSTPSLVTRQNQALFNQAKPT